MGTNSTNIAKRAIGEMVDWLGFIGDTGFWEYLETLGMERKRIFDRAPTE